MNLCINNNYYLLQISQKQDSSTIFCNVLSGKFKMNTGHIQKVRLLYKTILKLHRGMPPELQLIGDNYVKDEFKRHKKCKPDEAEIFIKEWSTYTITLAKQLGMKNIGKSVIGRPITEDILNSLRDDQIQQLYELMVSAKETPNK